MGIRAHFVDHHLDNKGEPIAGAAVYVRDQHADPALIDDLIAATIYENDSDHASPNATLANPFLTDADGKYEIFLAEPARVDLKIVTPGGLLQDETRTVDVTKTPNDGASLTSFSETIGDGAETSFVVEHGLGTLDVTVDVFKVSTGATVEPDILRTSVDEVTVEFTSAPSADEYRVVVVGSHAIRPRILCGNTTAQSFPTSGANNDMTFDRVSGSSGLLLSNKKFTASEAGTWRLRVSGEWKMAASSRMQVEVYKNGVDGSGTLQTRADVLGNDDIFGADIAGVPFHIEFFDDISAGDYFTIFCYPSAGVANVLTFKSSLHPYATLTADFEKVA